MKAWSKKPDQEYILIETPKTDALKDALRMRLSYLRKNKANSLKRKISQLEQKALLKVPTKALFRAIEHIVARGPITIDKCFHHYWEAALVGEYKFSQMVIDNIDIARQINDLGRELSALEGPSVDQLTQVFPNDKEVQKYLKDIELSKRKVLLSREFDEGMLSKLRYFVHKTMQNLNKDPVPIGCAAYGSIGACYENSKGQGGAYAYLRSKIQESIRKRELVVDLRRYGRDPDVLYEDELIVPNEVLWDSYIDTLPHSGHKSRIATIPEKGGKYRVANVTSVACVARAQPLGDQVISLLKRHPAIKGEYINNPQYIANRLFSQRNKRKLERKFYSTDMNQSTDTIRKEVVKAVIDGIASGLNWHPRHRNAALETVEPMLCQYMSDFTGKTYEFYNLNGTLLGLPLSFGILNLVHLFCVEQMSDTGKKRTVVYGDDMATFCTEDDWVKYQTACSQVGFTLNMSKTHIGASGFTFCGKIYRVSGENCFWIKAAKLSIITGASNLKCNWIEELDKNAEASHLCNTWQVGRLIEHWKTKNPKVSSQVKKHNIAFAGPLEGGALGFKGAPMKSVRRRAIYSHFTRTNKFERMWTYSHMPMHLQHEAAEVYEAANKLTRFKKRVKERETVPTRDFVSYCIGSKIAQASLDVTEDKRCYKKIPEINKLLYSHRKMSNSLDTIINNILVMKSIKDYRKLEVASKTILAQVQREFRKERVLLGEAKVVLDTLPRRYNADYVALPSYNDESWRRLAANDRPTLSPNVVHKVLKLKS